MQVPVMIAGQGLCGTWLSYWLYREGIDFLVFDPGFDHSSTMAASGTINPVTGRRMSTTWLAEDVIPFAASAYGELEAFLRKEGLYSEPEALIQQLDVIDFFSSPDRRLEFEKRAAQGSPYLFWPSDENDYQPYFQYQLGYGIVSPAWQINLQALLRNWRRFLERKGRLVPESIQPSDLVFKAGGLACRGMEAERLIWCDGASAVAGGYFHRLPFAPMKGQALIIHAEGLPPGHIYKKGLTITPRGNGTYWVGSSYEREFSDPYPDATFREATTAWLGKMLRHPFQVLNYLAAVRPATVERRPFAGFHPRLSCMGLVNGMGTKGASLAPFFTQQLVQKMLYGSPLMREVDVSHFQRLLNE